jgi:hypothetical protein
MRVRRWHRRGERLGCGCPTASDFQRKSFFATVCGVGKFTRTQRMKIGIAANNRSLCEQ